MMVWWYWQNQKNIRGVGVSKRSGTSHRTDFSTFTEAGSTKCSGLQAVDDHSQGTRSRILLCWSHTTQLPAAGQILWRPLAKPRVTWMPWSKRKPKLCVLATQFFAKSKRRWTHAVNWELSSSKNWQKWFCLTFGWEVLWNMWHHQQETTSLIYQLSWTRIVLAGASLLKCG